MVPEQRLGLCPRWAAWAERQSGGKRAVVRMHNLGGRCGPIGETELWTLLRNLAETVTRCCGVLRVLGESHSLTPVTGVQKGAQPHDGAALGALIARYAVVCI